MSAYTALRVTPGLARSALRGHTQVRILAALTTLWLTPYAAASS